MNTKPSKLILFSKEPAPGFTKTRLIPDLGNIGAAILHKNMIIHILNNVIKSDISCIEISAAPDTELNRLKEVADCFNLKINTQKGNNLGERMFNSINSALKEYSRVLIIGTDCPAIKCRHINEADNVLKEDRDVVIGPCEDGGYYLIGARKIERAIFENITWGSSEVLTNTRKTLNKLKYNWQELEELWDIDSPADLIKLKSKEYSHLINW